jgi:hypothetical protein
MISAGSKRWQELCECDGSRKQLDMDIQRLLDCNGLICEPPGKGSPNPES